MLQEFGWMRFAGMLRMGEIDRGTADWFRARLGPTQADVLSWMSGLGCEVWVTTALVGLVALFIFRKRWQSLATVLLTIPCGSLLGEGIKLLVRRQRPFVGGPFGEWGGYSFPSGHTLAATLLYGCVVLLLSHRIRERHWRALLATVGAGMVLTVAFSRVALGAHYVTDVMASMVLGSGWAGLCAVGVAAARERWFTRAEPVLGKVGEAGEMGEPEPEPLHQAA